MSTTKYADKLDGGSVPSGSYSCSNCGGADDGACWCSRMRAAAELLVMNEIYRPQMFLDAYGQMAGATLEVANV